MCGIAGIYRPLSRENNIVNYEQLVSKMVDSQYSRGPDNQAVEVYEGNRTETVFGHNRLSIIDLSTEANQPFQDKTGRYSIVYNGEIYNYLELRAELISLGRSFITTSDTEVLLEAFIEWGPDAANHFDGMFAFAVFDRETEKVWLVRDRFGVKPLYYYIKNNCLYFASTGKILAKHFSLKPNLQYLARGLRFWVYEDDSDITQYENLYALKSGHYLCADIDNNGLLNIRLEKYYDLYNRARILKEQLVSDSFSKLTERVLHVLTSAINIRLRADVPIGVSLSGGLDSSTVASFAAEQHPEIIGFTFGSPEHKQTEGPLVQELVNKIGIKTYYIWPEKEELIPAFWDTLEAQDSPFPGCSIVAQNLVYKTVKKANVKVLLGGQGGDESFLGYRKFNIFYIRELLKNKKYFNLIRFAASLMPMFFAELHNLKKYWDIRKRYTSKTGVESGLNLPEFFGSGIGVGSNVNLTERQIADIMQFSLPTLLRYEDRNSMGHSIESRLPFLDYRLIELAVALPEALKLSKGYGKWVVRDITQGMIPDSIRLARYKRGFDVSDKMWVDAGLGQSIRDMLFGKLDSIRDVLPQDTDISKVYSDEQLRNNRKALGEVIALAWIAKQ